MAEPRGDALARRGERVRASGLSKRFAERSVLDSVSLSIAAGEVVALLGTNGAGKSTLTAILAGVLRPDEGTVSVATTAASTRRAIGFVPQQLALYPMLTVGQNLRFMAQLYGVSDPDRRIAAALAALGIEARTTDRVEALSGGLQRRLAIAMSLLHDPEFLLLDEATVGIDPQSRERIFDAVRERAARGAAVLFTTHQIAEAERSCDRVIILDRGRVLLEGSVSDIVAKHGRSLVDVGIAGEPSCAEAMLARLRLEGLPGQLELQPHGLRWRPLCAQAEPALLMHALQKSGLAYRSVRIVPASLEAAFLELTGSELRD